MIEYANRQFEMFILDVDIEENIVQHHPVLSDIQEVKALNTFFSICGRRPNILKSLMEGRRKAKNALMEKANLHQKSCLGKNVTHIFWTRSKEIKKHWKYSYNQQAKISFDRPLHQIKIIRMVQGNSVTEKTGKLWQPQELTAKNTVISPNFQVWKFCGKAQFPHSFGRIARNYAETVLFHKISTPGN